MGKSRSRIMKISCFVTLALCATYASAATIKVVNQSGFDIYQLYLSPTEQSTWGPDLLGEWILENGQYYTLKMQCGTYDVRLIDEDGDTCTLAALYMCGNEEAHFDQESLLGCQYATGVASNEIAEVTVVNQSGYDIYQFYVSSSASSVWGPDQLGESVLENGQFITLAADCGDYDVRIVDEDGDVCELAQVPLCGGETAYISQDDLLSCQGF